MTDKKLHPSRWSDASSPKPGAQRVRQKGRAAQSFNASEIDALVDIMTVLMRSGDAGALARNPHARSVHMKFVKMKQKLEGRKP